MSHTIFNSFCRLLGSVATALVLCLPANAAGLRQFSPQGQIDQQVRATAMFTTDMVPLGQSDAAAPFVVDCGAVKGKGRWSDARSWSYALERPLQPGERCDFRLKPGLKAANGEAIYGEAGYAFFAPGPWPRSIMPRPGGAIEEDQAFVVDASGALKRESVERNVWCEADGVGNRIPVRILPDATRNEILATLHRHVESGTLVIACAERLPAGAKMRLVWGKGVEAETGAKSSRNESFPYNVREPFRASFSCEREKASGPCSPLSDLRVEFSVPINIKLAAGVRLAAPDGVRSPLKRESEEARENTVRDVVFKRPFPQNAELKIELPADVKDEAGRPLSNAASFPLKVRTGTLPPLAKFSGDFGIVEWQEGGVLPVTLRNIEAKLQLNERRLTDDAEIIAAMQALARFERQTKKVRVMHDGKAEDYEDPYYARELTFLARQPNVTKRDLPKPGGSAEFEVVGIPLAKPGFHIVEVERLYPLPGSGETAEVATKLSTSYFDACLMWRNLAQDMGRIALHHLAVTPMGWSDAVQQSLQALETFSDDYGALPDLIKADNLMMRKDGTLVFSDPVFME